MVHRTSTRTSTTAIAPYMNSLIVWELVRVLVAVFETVRAMLMIASFAVFERQVGANGYFL